MLHPISYSNYKSYRECPQKYRFKQLKTPYPEENKINAFFGSVVGTLFEEFYLDKMWEHPDPLASLLEKYPTVVKRIAFSSDYPGKSYLDFRGKGSIHKSMDVFDSDVRQALANGVQAILRHDLVSSDAKAEVVLDVPYPEAGLFLVGRADFVLTSNTHGKVILDGKGSRHGTKYLDLDQLYWYSLQTKLLGLEVPKKVGYLLWRYSGDETVAWYDLEPECLAVLESRLRTFSKFLKNENPQARMGSHCKFCPYVPHCPSGQIQLGGSVGDEVFGVKKNGNHR